MDPGRAFPCVDLICTGGNVETLNMRSCVIPAYRATSSIARVIASVLPYVERVIVVDDGCPDGTGDVVHAAYGDDARVHLIRASKNRGVGGAMKLGIAKAVADGAESIVKIDADGQMDPRYIPDLFRVLDSNPKVAFVKGNRFLDGSITRVMPIPRLIGNSALTLMVRIATGYWNSVDPTNGFFAIRASALARIDAKQLANRYYFEISLMAALGLRRTEIAEVEMPAIYGDVPSNLSIVRTMLTFPFYLGASFVKRIFWQYVIADMNVGSLLLIVGLLLSGFSATVGSIWWAQALRSGIPTTPGTATIVVASLIMGFQLLLNALLYDVQFSSRVAKIGTDDLNVRFREYAVARV